MLVGFREKKAGEIILQNRKAEDEELNRLIAKEIPSTYHMIIIHSLWFPYLMKEVCSIPEKVSHHLHSADTLHQAESVTSNL